MKQIQRFMLDYIADELFMAYLDCNEPVKILEGTYLTSYALRRLDPTAYRCYFNEWMDAENIVLGLWEFQPRELLFPDDVARKIAPLSYKAAIQKQLNLFCQWQTADRAPYVNLDETIYYYIDDAQYYALSDDELLAEVMKDTDFPMEAQ